MDYAYDSTQSQPIIPGNTPDLPHCGNCQQHVYVHVYENGDRHWVHVEGGYPCRDGIARTGTYAAPPPPPRHRGRHR